MEIKTNIELLNEISAKIGGKSDASVLVEGLNNIANALGDTDPDQMVTVSQALQTVLDHMDGGGGGGGALKGKIRVKIVNSSSSPIMPIARVEDPVVLFIENGLYYVPLSPEDALIESSGEGNADYVVIGNYDGEALLYEVNPKYMVGSQAEVKVDSVTDAVNCAYEYQAISITDPSIEASCTITYVDQGV